VFDQFLAGETNYDQHQPELIRRRKPPTFNPIPTTVLLGDSLFVATSFRKKHATIPFLYLVLSEAIGKALVNEGVMACGGLIYRFPHAKNCHN